MRVPRYEHPVFAAQYDLSEGDVSHLDDREWYAARVRTACAAPAAPGGVVLEIGAGTGRVTRALVRQLLRPLIAVDVGLPMLRRLRAVAPRAHAVCGDMTRLPLATGAAVAAVSAYNVLGCLLEPPDLTACAESLARVVRPGGRLLFDIAIHHAGDYPPGPRRFDWASWRTAEGLEIRRRVTIVHDPGRDRLSLVYEYVWRTPEGAEERRTVPFALNTWPPETYLDALGKAGFETTDTDERTFEGPSGRTRMWVFIEAVRR